MRTPRAMRRLTTLKPCTKQDLLADDGLYERLRQKLNQLGGKLNQLIQGVELQHRSVREDSAEYTRDEDE
jgi:hypothetical protein